MCRSKPWLDGAAAAAAGCHALRSELHVVCGSCTMCAALLRKRFVAAVVWWCSRLHLAALDTACAVAAAAVAVIN